MIQNSIFSWLKQRVTIFNMPKTEVCQEPTISGEMLPYAITVPLIHYKEPAIF